MTNKFPTAFIVGALVSLSIIVGITLNAISRSIASTTPGKPSVAAVIPDPYKKRHEIERELPLRKMGDSFFIFVHQYHKGIPNIYVYFCFPYFDEWLSFSRPISMFRVKFDEQIKVPTIKFNAWGTENERTDDYIDKRYGGDIDRYLGTFLMHITVVCREDQWTPNSLLLSTYGQ
jgi:hypothetical protein